MYGNCRKAPRHGGVRFKKRKTKDVLGSYDDFLRPFFISIFLYCWFFTMLLISTTNSYAFKNSQRKVFTERLSPSFFMKSPKNTQLDNRWKPPPPPPVSSWNPSRLILGTLFASFGMCGYAAYGVLEQGSCGSCRGSWGCKVLVGVFVAIPYQVDVKKNMFLLKMYTCTSTHVWTICTYIYIYMSLIYIYIHTYVWYIMSFFCPEEIKHHPKSRIFWRI